MRGLCLVSLAVLLYPKCSLSLQCYTCMEIQGSSAECLRSSCPGVCFKTNMSITTPTAEKTSVHFKGCALTCDSVSTSIQDSANSMLNLYSPGTSIHMDDVYCCEKNFCNGGSRLQTLASAGFLLLSLGSILLCTLL